MARQRCVITAMVDQLDPQTVLLRFRKIAEASTGLVQTDLPQSELGRFAELVLKTRTQKIRSVNFVPPLIKPWDYDRQVITSTVASTIKASENAASAKAAAKASSAPNTTSSSATKAKVAKPQPEPGTEVKDPAKAAGSAAESDLSSVCSAAS